MKLLLVLCVLSTSFTSSAEFLRSRSLQANETVATTPTSSPIVNSSVTSPFELDDGKDDDDTFTLLNERLDRDDLILRDDDTADPDFPPPPEPKKSGEKSSS
mmetsp:Transcript_21294/g.30625  ORF Transcript_21294/g.30625 Transcript_21294/m.30625 type:complete len:102 (-) Transcript_21294:104-409(-)|eukprot:CAMPEP_0202446904 /NCGR_PEP_ID=MMETSP1360-20130828/5498_1 /ASSEMBLY_ACC=CAM_ASM_000848 /TAXON_ID=515479 /ORGANISM="Licmophora paradoxa, Strain CCMP2313" /LENGTH=101 /DNA_ID=CAMNT_0049063659 /DNA_START=98 /DNA_END=403 /DNA_ORIENTATION=+